MKNNLKEKETEPFKWKCNLRGRINYFTLEIMDVEKIKFYYPIDDWDRRRIVISNINTPEHKLCIEENKDNFFDIWEEIENHIVRLHFHTFKDVKEFLEGAPTLKNGLINKYEKV